ELSVRRAGEESLEEPERSVWKALKDHPLASPVDVATVYAQLLASAESKAPGTEGEPRSEALPELVSQSLKNVLEGPGSVTDIGSNNDRVFERDNHDKLRQLRRKVEEWQTQSPDAPPR